jgi:hypothetical protein
MLFAIIVRLPHTLYDAFIKHKNECEFLSQPGSWEVTKDQGTNNNNNNQ